MPTRYLSDAQRRRFGHFDAAPSREDLAKCFVLDQGALLAIRDLRGAHNRLGYATLLCSVRFLGTFPETADHVPSEVLSFLRGQLGIGDDIDLGGYFRSRTHERHVRSIRERHGFMHFGDAARARFRLSRWLYAECWAGNERPGALVLVAADWLIEHKVLLPGISTLERLVGRIRERARQRLWRRLAAGLSDAQRAQVADLFERDDESLGGLEILRASPLKRQPTQFAKHLDRLEAVRSFGLRPTPPGGVPAVQLERLARVAKTSKPSAIAALQEPRRTATVAALFYTLEASAQDDATELGEALVSDLFREAEMARLALRVAHQKEMDGAVMVLRSLAGMVLSDDGLPLDAWRDAVFAHLPKDRIKDAMTTVDGLVQPESSRPVAELKDRWSRARKLFLNIVTRIDLAAAPGGRAVTEAMDWLRDHPDWNDVGMKDAPTAVVSRSWQPCVLDGSGKVADPKAYVFATIESWHKAVKRRDVFAAPGIRYADPRIGMLERQAWQNAKGTVCRTLGRTLDGQAEVQRLAGLLDETFRRVAGRADRNPELTFETEKGRRRISVARLDRLAEPDSLLALRSRVRDLMPKGGIPDILLEVMRRTGFSRAFTRLDDQPVDVTDFETSLCAVLVAQACNIGFEPLVRDDHPALRQSRLSWLGQNFVRPETLDAANAVIVSAQKDLAVAAHWGDGQTASADGLRFLAPKSAIHAGPNPKYFRQGRGITWYNMLSDQYSGIGAMVVPGTLRDSLVILALLLDQETELDPSNVMTDSAAYSDSMFGLFWLLGYRFCPRLADIGGARLWRVDKAAQYGPLGEIAEGTVNIKLVVDNWEDLIRLAGSLRLGHLKAAGVMRILQTRDRPTTLARALMHLGRIVKTLHVLNYIDDADFRRRILVQLNRQELRHKLARRIYHGNRGEVRNALRQGQEEQLGALGLALNAVTHWNAVYMQEALARLGEQGLDIDPKDVARLSPVLWQHINFLGRYEIILPESVALGRLRPLRDTTSAWEF